MSANQNPFLSPEDYLYQERQAECKNEYLNGEIYAMAGASRNHNQITSNLLISLGNQLLKKPCSVYVSDMKVFHYQLIPSLQEYLLVSQYYCRVEHYQRREDQQWIYREFHSMQDQINLSTLDCSLSVKEVYRRVRWEKNH